MTCSPPPPYPTPPTDLDLWKVFHLATVQDILQVCLSWIWVNIYLRLSATRSQTLSCYGFERDGEPSCVPWQDTPLGKRFGYSHTKPSNFSSCSSFSSLLFSFHPHISLLLFVRSRSDSELKWLPRLQVIDFNETPSS